MFNVFLDFRWWIGVVVLAAITVTVSVAKYKVGQGGIRVLKEHYPQVGEERWERMHGYFIRWGAPLVLFSFVPVLTWIIPPAAGAFGVRFRTFLIFAFLAKMLRYWILAFIIAGTYQMIT